MSQLFGLIRNLWLSTILQATMKKILLLNLLLIAWGCKPDELHHPIVGDWRWVSSIGGIATLILKPRNSDEHILRFKADGVFEVYTNDVLFYSGKYRLSAAESIYDAEQKPSLVIDDFVRHKKDTVNFYPLFPMSRTIIRQFSNKQLELADNCNDCFSHSFVRK